MRLGTWAKPRRLLESDEGLSEEDLAKLAETIQKDGLPDPRAPPNGGEDLSKPQLSRSQLDALASQLQQTHARVVHPDGRTDGYVLHPDDMPEMEAPSFGESSPELGNVMGQLTEEQKATLRAQLGHEL